MRINITQAKSTTEHLAIEDTTAHELLKWLKALIEKQNLSIFAEGPRTTVQVRESIKGINGASYSFSFRGLTPLQVKKLITKELEGN